MSEERDQVSARALLARRGLRPKKSWGQNFLEDRRVIERIAAAAVPESFAGAALADRPWLVEIGAGTGALTRALAARGARVLAVERDPDLVALLSEELAQGEAAGGEEPAVQIVAMDALAFDFAAVIAAAGGRPITVVGNLPYQITTPLLFRVLRAAAGGGIGRAVFMVQKEVAERLAAGPDRKSYGRLSVMVQQAAEVKVLFHVGPGAFLPPPQVTSTVFALAPRATPLVPVADPALFAAVVRAAFAGRRKMLRRSLEPPFGGEVARAALAAAAIAETRRAEELTVQEFGRLTDALAARGARAAAEGGAEETDDGEEP